MNTITKRIGTFGAAGAAASVLVIGGLAVPAQASGFDRSNAASDHDYSYSETVDLLGGVLGDGISGNESVGNGIVGNDTSLLNGGLLNGDIANGDIANGGIVNAPLVDGPLLDDSLTSDIGDVASGNAVASGNDTSVEAPVDVPVEAPIGSGNDVEAPVGSGNDTSVGDTGTGDIGTGDIGAEVNDLVDNTLDDAIGDIDLGAILGR